MFTEEELYLIEKTAFENQDYMADFDLAHALNDLAVAARQVLTLLQNPNLRIYRDKFKTIIGQVKE